MKREFCVRKPVCLILALVIAFGFCVPALAAVEDFVPEATSLEPQNEPMLAAAVKTGWQYIDDSWYYFDSTGAMVTSNWASDKYGWYFMGPDGKMMEGFREIALGRPDDGWYYFNPKHDGSYGRALTGWQQLGRIWYYFNPKHDGTFGRMVRGDWVSDKTGWYFMDEDGEMMEGLSEIALGRSDDGLYYFNPKHDGSYGRVLTGWHYIDGAWYYFNPSHDGTWGRAYDDGWHKIGGNDYYFYSDGVMAANTMIDGWYVNSSGECLGGVGTGSQAYLPVISEYRWAQSLGSDVYMYTAQFDYVNNISNWAISLGNQLQYAFFDVDYDGTSEMLILLGGGGGTYDPVVIDILYQKNGKIRSLLPDGMPRERLYVGGNGIIANSYVEGVMWGTFEICSIKNSWTSPKYTQKYYFDNTGGYLSDMQKDGYKRLSENQYSNKLLDFQAKGLNCALLDRHWF